MGSTRKISNAVPKDSWTIGVVGRVVYITQNIAGLHNLEYSGHPFLALGEQMGMANSMNA